jgi:hypothetical protein
MKQRHDLRARERNFQPGDQILALLPISGRPLQAIFLDLTLLIRKLGV